MDYFPIFYTGVRKGDIIEAIPGSKQNAGTILHVEGVYPPSKLALNTLDNRSWIHLVKYIKQRSPYFLNKTDEDVRKWLVENSTENEDLYLSDTNSSYEPPEVSVENIGGTIFTDNIRDKYSKDGLWKLHDIYKAIPPKSVASRARRHTLVFRPNIWRLKSKTKLPTTYEGIVFDMYTMKYQQGITGIETIVLQLNNDSRLGISLNPNATSTKLPKIEELYTLIKNLLPEATDESIQSIYRALKWFSPSVHKSLIQKIIRRSPPYIIGPDRKWQSGEVLLVSFAMLLIHPGVFVPDLQTFVTGLESATKRLAVSINEDSYIDTPNVLLSLYIGALISRPRGSWYPSISLINMWMKLALESYKEDRYYKYGNLYDDSIRTKRAYLPTSPYDASYLILEKLKSFPTDINMLAYIAFNKGDSSKNENIIRTPMHIVRAIDHHNRTDLLYMIDPTTPELAQLFGTNSYAPIISILWDKVSGINARKLGVINLEDPFVKAITAAQWRIYRVETRQTYERKVIADQTESMLINLDDEYLAGLLGSLEIKFGKKTFIVSLDSKDISDRLVILRPTRGQQDFNITLVERSQVIKVFDDTLRRGKRVTVPSGLAWLFPNNKYVVITLTDVGSFNINNNSWDDMKIQDVALPLHPILKFDPQYTYLEAAMVTKGNGIEYRAFEELDMIDIPLDVLRRIVTYLRGARSRILMLSISRLGIGTEYSVDPIDVKVYNIFARLSVLFPGILRLRSAKEFTIKNTIIMRKIFDILRARLALNDESNTWNPVKLPRPLFRHQLEARDLILTGEKDTYILDMPIGSGKTAIIADVIRILIENQNMPRYVVYTLPPSAIDNIQREFALYNYNTIHLDPRGAGPPLTLQGGYINLIYHDHLKHRRVRDVLKLAAPDSLFIVDEFHYTLNPTQRTSISLELARLSHLTIAMSGTPIKDTHIDQLIPWLEMIVEFEVTIRNFWVAMGAMIRRRVDLNIKVNYKDIEAEMTRKEEQTYFTLMNGEERTDANSFRQAIAVAYDACDRYMVTLASENHNIFMVARNKVHQQELMNMLVQHKIRKSTIFLITSDTQITLTPQDKTDIRIVITTIQHNTGYTLTAISTMITGVYFTNEATRSQLVGRLVRIGQPKKEVDVITVHSGILTQIMHRYDEARNMNMALKSIAKEIGVEDFKHISNT